MYKQLLACLVALSLCQCVRAYCEPNQPCSVDSQPQCGCDSQSCSGLTRIYGGVKYQFCATQLSVPECEPMQFALKSYTTMNGETRTFVKCACDGDKQSLVLGKVYRFFPSLRQYFCAYKKGKL